MMHSKKQLHSQSKPCYKHLWSLGRFKPGPAKVKKDSTHIFAGWNLFSTIEKGVVLVLPKKHAPWQHHYGVELALVRLLVQSTQSHGQPCLQLNKSFCFSSPQTVETIVTHDLPLPKQWQVHMGLAEGQQDCSKHNHRNQANALKSIPVTRS